MPELAKGTDPADEFRALVQYSHGLKQHEAQASAIACLQRALRIRKGISKAMLFSARGHLMSLYFEEPDPPIASMEREVELMLEFIATRDNDEERSVVYKVSIMWGGGRSR